jgi:hypothetical protein
MLVLRDLGLEEDYSEAVLRKWRQLEHDDTPEGVLQSHFEYKLGNLEEGELCQHHLLGLGFTEESANEILLSIKHNPLGLLAVDLLRSKTSTVFQQNLAPLPAWAKATGDFSVQCQSYTDFEASTIEKVIDIQQKMLKSSENGRPLVEDEAASHDEEEDGMTTTYYHGTSLWSADIILKSGINLKNGSRKQYFSNADGFYVTDRLDIAVNYAIKTSSKTCCRQFAVLVYKFPDGEDPLEVCEGGIDVSLHHDVERYKKIVKYFKDEFRPLVPHIDHHGLPHHYEESVPFIVGPDTSTPCAGKKICIRNKVLHTSAVLNLGYTYP